MTFASTTIYVLTSIMSVYAVIRVCQHGCCVPKWYVHFLSLFFSILLVASPGKAFSVVVMSLFGFAHSTLPMLLLKWARPFDHVDWNRVLLLVEAVPNHISPWTALNRHISVCYSL